jgi:glucose uptake protein GlcU
VSVIGFIWGVGGILALLTFAIVRLGAVALELDPSSLPAWQLLVLAAWFAYMVWAEGYKGFHKAFAPRVVVRANYLANHPKPVHVLLAPLYCMGYVHATARRRITSMALTSMIICFVLLVRLLPQPWRSIVDVGVVAGLMFGVGSIVYYLLQLRQRGVASLPVSADVPVSS